MSATGRGREREPDDYYTTPSWAVRRLFERWSPMCSGAWVEPSAGNGAIIRAVNAILDREMAAEEWRAFEIREEERADLTVLCDEHVRIGDFLQVDDPPDNDVSLVIGNPPFSKAFEFLEQARKLFPKAEVCFLLRLAFAASEARNPFMRATPPDVYVLPQRPAFTGEGTDSAEYAWFIFPWAHACGPRAWGSFRVLNLTPLAERQRDRGHAVMIESPQKELFT